MIASVVKNVALGSILMLAEMLNETAAELRIGSFWYSTLLSAATGTNQYHQLLHNYPAAGL